MVTDGNQRKIDLFFITDVFNEPLTKNVENFKLHCTMVRIIHTSIVEFFSFFEKPIRLFYGSNANPLPAGKIAKK